jgi:hypothetical protein
MSGVNFETHVAISYKNHVSYRSTWEYNSTNQLADQIKAALLVRDSHDYAYGDEKDATDAQSQKKSVPWQVDRIAVCVLAPSLERHSNLGTYYSTTNIPTAIMTAKVTRYQLSGASS